MNLTTSLPEGPDPAPAPPPLRIVPARYYDVLLPPSGSGVRLSPVAQRHLSRWPPTQQLALYTALSNDQVPLAPVGGDRAACRLANGQYLVVSRQSGWIVVQSILDRWLPVH